MNYLAHIVTEQSVTIVTDEETIMVPRSHISYDDVVELLDLEEYMDAIAMADATQRIEDFGEGKVTVIGGVVFYNGQELHNSLTRRILAMVKDGFSVGPMVQFLTNLMSNPSQRAVTELYRFLEHNDLPITLDGHLLAYKNVAANYRDRHSQSFDNSIGSVCEMERNQVMDDPSITCSTGLHFCSIEYLKGFWGTDGHTMVVKINPRDVVSIPLDYNDAKGRCSRYEVIAEHTNGTKDTLSDSSVYQENYHNKRGADGRFVAV
jgi:hypothetical protein